MSSKGVEAICRVGKYSYTPSFVEQGAEEICRALGGELPPASVTVLNKHSRIERVTSPIPLKGRNGHDDRLMVVGFQRRSVIGSKFDSGLSIVGLVLREGAYQRGEIESTTNWTERISEVGERWRGDPEVRTQALLDPSYFPDVALTKFYERFRLAVFKPEVLKQEGAEAFLCRGDEFFGVEKENDDKEKRGISRASLVIAYETSPQFDMSDATYYGGNDELCFLLQRGYKVKEADKLGIWI